VYRRDSFQAQSKRDHVSIESEIDGFARKVLCITIKKCIDELGQPLSVA
jgi:hypothetical protein